MVEITEPTTPTIRDHLARATKFAPMVRYVPKNPAFLIGAAVVGLLGTLAWRNREKIAQKAKPLLQDAADRARPLIEEAAERGAALRERLPGRKTDLAH